MHRITRCSDIPEGESRGYEIETENGDSVNLFIVKKNDNYFAYENRCPHLGVNLDWIEHEFLDEEKGHIQCATHMALFNIADGQCVAGPCVGDHLTALPVSIDGEDIFVDVSHI